MHKLLGPVKYGIAGVAFGYVAVQVKDLVHEHRWSLTLRANIQDDLLKPSESLFKSNEFFLKENLKEFYVISMNDNEGHFEYLPKKASQGHMTVCHGGFTGCMAEYAGRYFALTHNLDPHINHFYIRYLKPMFVEHLYHIIVRKSETISGRIEYEIWDKDQKLKYCMGHFSASAKAK